MDAAKQVDFDKMLAELEKNLRGKDLTSLHSYFPNCPNLKQLNTGDEFLRWLQINGELGADNLDGLFKAFTETYFHDEANCITNYARKYFASEENLKEALLEQEAGDYDTEEEEISIPKDGKAVQIMEFNSKKKKYKIMTKTLQKILLHPDVVFRRVVVIALSGKARIGKSFALCYFLRYLKNQGKSNWMKDSPSGKLDGFEWKTTRKSQTIGMYTWAPLPICKASNGENVAVMLIDTQGLFDDRTSQNEMARLFAFSTSITSVQVLNVKEAIMADNMYFLESFVRYGKEQLDTLQLEKNKSNPKPFQNLMILVRDWQWQEEFDFGEKGGTAYLHDEFDGEDNEKSEEMQQNIGAVKACFETVSGYLLPHPGREASRKKFTGRSGDLYEEFTKNMKDFVESLLAPDKLILKNLYGIEATCGMLFETIKMNSILLNFSDRPLAEALDLVNNLLFFFSMEFTMIMYVTKPTPQFW